jgi:hypothetical protein
MRNRWEDEKNSYRVGRKIDKNENLLLLSVSRRYSHTIRVDVYCVCAYTAPLYEWRRCWIELRKTRRRPKRLALGNRPRWKTTRYIHTRLWVYSVCVGSNRNKDRTQQQPNKQQGEKNVNEPISSIGRFKSLSRSR